MRIAVYILVFALALLGLRTIIMKHIQQRIPSEMFIPSLSLIVDEKLDKLTLQLPSSFVTQNLVHNDLKNVVFEQVETIASIKWTKSCVLDAFSAYQRKNSSQFLTTIGTDSVAYFIRSLEIPSKGFQENGVVIGYINPFDALLVDNIMSSRKDTMTTYSLVQVTPSSTINKQFFIDNKIDVLFVYETLEGAGITRTIDKHMKLEVWDYAEGLNVHALKVTMPFIKHKNIDFSLYFDQLKGKLDIVSSVVAFDNIIMLSQKDATNSNIANERTKLIQLFNKPETINLYERYFTVTKESMNTARQRSAFLLQRDSLQVLEQFTDTAQRSQFMFQSNDNVNGFYDAQKQLFFVYSDKVEGIPLKKGSLFRFAHQIRDEQNGIYKVTKESQKQSILEKVSELENQQSQVLQSVRQPGYLCYNHPDISSKAACESPYDVEGNRKREQTYWDKPCERHLDCPFYQANKNYDNYRGGCIDGRCEMPIGVKPVSYRLFDKEISIALCHNCKSNNPTCCQEQNDKVKYPLLKGPDYAFELDEFERPLTLLAKHQLS